MIDSAILRAIQAADPDGGSVEPTEAMYAAHKRWATERFGEAAWRAYNTPGWADRDMRDADDFHTHNGAF